MAGWYREMVGLFTLIGQAVILAILVWIVKPYAQQRAVDYATLRTLPRMETVKHTIGDAFSRGLEEFKSALRTSSEAVIRRTELKDAAMVKVLTDMHKLVRTLSVDIVYVAQTDPAELSARWMDLSNAYLGALESIHMLQIRCDPDVDQSLLTQADALFAAASPLYRQALDFIRTLHGKASELHMARTAVTESEAMVRAIQSLGQSVTPPSTTYFLKRRVESMKKQMELVEEIDQYYSAESPKFGSYSVGLTERLNALLAEVQRKLAV